MSGISSSRTVYTHGCVQDGHEAATHDLLARRLAGLLGFAFGGACENFGIDETSYLIPRTSLSGAETASRYRIGHEGDLLGGWVPEAYMATKAILHPLVSPRAAAPPGWPERLTRAASDVTLPGFTAFSLDDARAAGEILRPHGPVRAKPVHGTGGHGQAVAATALELEDALAHLAAQYPPGDGLVLEADLSQVITYSVGQLRLPHLTVSYCGTQFLTTDNTGHAAYGGSELTAAVGGYENLPAEILPAAMARAAACAARFDGLADRHLSGLIASRRNYDVAAGRLAGGAPAMGVIDQSWRVGGATGAEIVAIEALSRNPDARAVRARSTEVYGAGQIPPEGALVCYHGEDPAVGPLLKYAFVEDVLAR
ncbi:DUF3182 family protein [Chelativorans sp. M5D2P16]|uniref:DUF3182 family protein n=1 Tax=Chelativorans sp. M5D2P16 TaxID=3095678 RepID=UPI002ACA1802|nr:DUF3182 family protein [Chelativorans sp. M5D2P16]MDZ5699435.1 DUF3182 family protein [Chelativorans sp. M5D2P16]